MNFDMLSDDLKEKASKCTTHQELLELAESEGVELSDEALEAVSGGVDWAPNSNCDEVCNFQNCGMH